MLAEVPQTGLSEPMDILHPLLPLWFEIIVLFFVCWLIFVTVVLRIVRHWWKFPTPSFFGALLNAPHRKHIQPPSMIINGLGLRSGMKVVEIGCGPGTYTVDIARAVLPDGMVYAVDIQEGMLKQLQKKMEKQGITNIVPVLADANGDIPLEDGVADAAYAVAVIGEIPDPVAALKQVHRLLVPGGFYAQSELAIDPDFPLRRTVKRWAHEAGLSFRTALGGTLRYVLVFEKPQRKPL